MDWPQVKEPFTSEELAYIEKIDPIEDIKILSSVLNFREICLRNFRIAETLLKKGAAAGLSLFDIGYY